MNGGNVQASMFPDGGRGDDYPLVKQFDGNAQMAAPNNSYAAYNAAGAAPLIVSAQSNTFHCCARTSLLEALAMAKLSR